MIRKIMNVSQHVLPEVARLYNTQANRIAVDGGTIVDAGWTVQVLNTLVELGLMSNVKFLGDANFAVKKDEADAVATLYDISGNNNDATQAVGANQPVWTASVQSGKYGLVFDGGMIV